MINAIVDDSCNGLEEVVSSQPALPLESGASSSFTLDFRPFQIQSVLLKFTPAQ